MIPLLLEKLGAGGPLIGLFAALRSLAFNFFQVFVAYGTHGRVKQKPFLAFIATLTRLPLLILPIFLWRGGVSSTARMIALAATFVIMTLWSIGDGLGYVPWMEIIARGFNEKVRGRFFATTQLISGLASIAVAGLVVSNVLRAGILRFPHNYALLVMVMALMMLGSLCGVLTIKEPPAPPGIHVRPPLREYFRRMPGLLRANPIFVRLCVVQLLVGFGTAAAPFYVLYATNHFRLGDEWGGKYQVMLAVGTAMMMPLWAYLSEKKGPAAAVRGVAVACLLTPIAAMTIGLVSPWAFGVVFLLMGGSLGWGMWIAMNHYLLSHVSHEDRPIFVALLNLLFAPSALYPFFGGMLVQHKHFSEVAHVPALFVITSAVVAVGLGWAVRLPAPESVAEE